MNVAVIGTRGIPANYGGVERHCEELYSRLSKNGVNVTIYNHQKYTGGYKENEYKNVNLRYLPTIPTKHFETIIHSFLSSIDCLFKNYDIVHFHSPGPSLFSFIPRLRGKKVIITLHALDWKREKWGYLARNILKLGERTAVMFADEIIVLTEINKDYFLNKYNRDVNVIPNGICIDNRPETETNILSKHSLQNRQYCLFVGRLVPEKGFNLLIEAYKGLNPEIPLVVVGDYNFYSKYISRLQDEKSPNIRLIGPLYGKDLYELYRNAYLFILPSTIEGMSISILEAFYLKAPVLVSNIPENLQIVKNEYGFSFNVNDINSLQDYLRGLISQPELTFSKVERAHQHVVEEYNWDKITEKTEKLYSNLKYI